MVAWPPSQRAAHLLFVFWIGALLTLGLELRLIHMEDVWSYWMPAYARYARPHWLDLGDGVLPWRKLVGMHPPLWALFSGALVHLGATLRGLLAVSLLASLGSAVLGATLLRKAAGRQAAILFVAITIIAPYQVHYATELNNYPLFQLGTAALAVSIAMAWDGGSRAVVALAMVVALTLWTHFASAPFVLALGVCAVATRRWRVAGAAIAGVLLASPILVEAASLSGGSQTFHNEPIAGLALLDHLDRVWAERFLPRWGSVAMGVATVLAGGWALAATSTRRLAFLLVMMGAVGAVWVLSGFASGASFFRQTPYWLPCSWLATVLLALGMHAAPRWGRGALVLLVGVWLAAVGQRTFAGPTDWDLSEASDRVRTYLDEDVDADAGDVVVYLWDGFINDQPHLRDPFFAQFKPRDLVPFVAADEPFPLFTSRWGRGRVAQVNGGLRGDPSGLSEAILAWTAAGRVVHLVQPGWEDERGPPEAGTVRGRVTAQGVRWTEWQFGRAMLVRLER